MCVCVKRERERERERHSIFYPSLLCLHLGLGCKKVQRVKVLVSYVQLQEAFYMLLRF